MRRRTVTALAVVLAVAAGVGVATAATPADPPAAAPADTPPATASFTAVDFAWTVSGSTSTQANIAPGGMVTFAYPTGASHHNADFGTGPQPTSCAQTAGADTGAVPPLPAQPTAAGWSGTCRFDTPGTYTFHCDLHPFMTATIVVGDAPPPPGPTTSASTTSTSTTSATTTASSPAPPPSSPPRAPASPLAGPPARAIVLAAVQHGFTVHGSLRISAAGAGGRAQVQVFAVGHRRVGRLVLRALGAGRVRAAVGLDAAARRTLRRQRRLAVTVAVTVTSREGARASAIRHVRMQS